jgi:hypothetical protein
MALCHVSGGLGGRSSRAARASQWRRLLPLWCSDGQRQKQLKSSLLRLQSISSTELDFDTISLDLAAMVVVRDRRRQDVELPGSSLKLLLANEKSIDLVASLLRLAKGAISHHGACCSNVSSSSRPESQSGGSSSTSARPSSWILPQVVSSPAAWSTTVASRSSSDSGEGLDRFYVFLLGSFLEKGGLIYNFKLFGTSLSALYTLHGMKLLGLLYPKKNAMEMSCRSRSFPANHHMLRS